MKITRNAAARMARKPTTSVVLRLSNRPNGIRLAAKAPGMGVAAVAALRAGLGDASAVVMERLKALADVRGPAAMRRKCVCGAAGWEAA